MSKIIDKANKILTLEIGVFSNNFGLLMLKNVKWVFKLQVFLNSLKNMECKKEKKSIINSLLMDGQEHLVLIVW